MLEVMVMIRSADELIPIMSTDFENVHKEDANYFNDFNIKIGVESTGTPNNPQFLVHAYYGHNHSKHIEVPSNGEECKSTMRRVRQQLQSIHKPL